MAYIYCTECDAGQDHPSFADAIHMKIDCHNCGHEIPLNHQQREEALIELNERITAIEQALGLGHHHVYR